MELKGKKDWSDFDAEESAERKPLELPKPVMPEAAPERPKEVFNLGLIFDRKDVPPETLQVVSQEHDHVKPEFVQGVTPGSQELESSTLAAAHAPQMEAARARQTAIDAEKDDDEGDEDDEDESGASDTTRQSSPTPAPVNRQFQQAEPRHAPVIEAVPPFTPFEAPVPVSRATEAPQAPYIPQMAEALTPADNEPSQPSPPNPLAYQPPPAPPPGATGGGGNKLPPSPPRQPGNIPSNPSEWPNDLRWQQPLSQPSPNIAPNMVTQSTFESSQNKLRRQMAARMILVAALTWYFARRPVKPLRQEVKHLRQTAAQQNEHISHLTYEQQAARRRIAEQQQQIEQFTNPQSDLFEQQAAAAFAASQVQGGRPDRPTLPQMVEQDAQAAPAQPGQPYEAGYGTMITERTQAASAAMYGEAYRQDIQHEQAGAGPLRRSDGRPMRTSSGGYAPASNFSTNWAGGQVATGHSLPTPGEPPIPESQLRQPKNPVAAAITSPWLWLGVGILLIAFFAAATI